MSFGSNFLLKDAVFYHLFADSVTKEVSDRDRKRIAELEEIEVNLRDEMSKLKVGHSCFYIIIFSQVTD